jgi:drug/metabolite transporter (DMT)-like permease
MALGACVTGHKYNALQYTAALVMGMGLAVLTAADVFTTANNHNGRLKLVRNLNVAVQNNNAGGLLSSDNNNSLEGFEDWALGPLLGPTLLTISTFFDSVVPNLQEQLMQSHKVQTSEMIFVSNAIMCIVLLGYTIYSRELMNAWDYCYHHFDASLVLLAQGISAYLGLQCYLAIIRDHGGVAAVLFANGRKIATIVLSFMLFAKPFNSRHFVGLVLVFLGVYLGYVSKKLMGGANKKKKKRRRKRDAGDDDNAGHHEHKV